VGIGNDTISGTGPKFYFKWSLETRTKPNIVIRFGVWLIISLFMGMRLPLGSMDLWKEHGRGEQATHYFVTNCKTMNPIKL